MMTATATIEMVKDPQTGDKLPLVLLTVGDGIKEFAALYDHLEALADEPEPTQQSLIVARSGTPKALYKSLRDRITEMPNVYIRRLDDSSEDCESFAHETGKFYAMPKKPGKGT